MLRGSGHIYFEVPTMILVFMSLGRWLEGRCRSAANQALDALLELLPENVTVLRAGSAISAPRSSIAVGDVVQVGPGERFAIDGVIAAGAAFIDLSVLTGESVPLCAGWGRGLERLTQPRWPPASRRHGGGRRRNDLPDARAHARGAALEGPVCTTRRSRGDLVRAGRLFVGGAGGRSARPEQRVRRGTDDQPVGAADRLPLRLGLATPLAISLALDRASREQVLFRSGAAVEQLAAIRAVRFDKTGTLTAGVAVLTACHPVDGVTETEALRIAASLAAHSRHEYSRAIVHAASQQQLETIPLVELETRPGRGIGGKSAATHQAYSLGSLQLMQDNGCASSSERQALIRDPLTAESPVAFVGCEGEVLALLTFSETLRAAPRAPSPSVNDCNLRSKSSPAIGPSAASG